jgi:Phycobilisome Linker polypeptide.
VAISLIIPLSLSSLFSTAFPDLEFLDRARKSLHLSYAEGEIEMTLPLLDYKLTTQNQRVSSFGTVDTNGDILYVYRLEDSRGADEIDELINAAYRQVFNEQEQLRFNRQIALETQLRNHSISVRDFIRGLAKSERFYRLVVEPNNNYRLVEMCLKRLLGRAPYNKDEEIAWSIVIATKGWGGFVDTLIDSDEYTQVFGDNVVPYQRKRGSSRVDLQACKLGTGRRFTTS